MKLKGIISVITISAFCCDSCMSIRQAGTHDFGDGYYRLKTNTEAPKQVYIVLTDSSLSILPLISNTKQPAFGSGKKILINGSVTDSLLQPFTLIRKSLDIDLSTVLLKYRFRNNTLPNQLSSTLNAAIYGGYRTDYFRIRDQVNPLLQRKRVIQHFEFDMGVFAGIGSTPVNSSTTANAISVEYDGVVFQKGVAFFIGSRNFTLGIGLGTDRLLDKNRKVWIYQEKPWLGLMIGLNLTN